MKAAYELVEAIQCRVCREVKLRKHFIRFPTHKQLEAWGFRAEHNNDYKIESDTCHDCKPITKPDLKRLRRNQLYELLRYGAITAVEYNAQLHERKELRRQRGASARTEGWQKRWRPLWEALIADLNHASRNATYQANHARKNKTASEATERYFAIQKEVFTTLRAALRDAAHRCEGAPPSTDWREYLHPLDVEALRTLWQGVRGPRVIPAIIDKLYRTDEYKPLYRASLAQSRLSRVQEMCRTLVINTKPVPTDSANTDNFLARMGVTTDDE